MANNGRVSNTDQSPLTNGGERNQLEANGNGNHSESIRSDEGEIIFLSITNQFILILNSYKAVPQQKM